MPHLPPFAPTQSLKRVEARLARRTRVKRLVIALSAGVVALLALVPAASHAQAPVVEATPASATPAPAPAATAPAATAPAPAGAIAPTPGVSPPATQPPTSMPPPVAQPAPPAPAPGTAAPPPTASPAPAPGGAAPAVPAPPPTAAQPRPPLTTPPPPPPRDAMVQRTAGPVTYICGGVAEDEQVALQRLARNFNMSLLFTQGDRGEYLSDVDVKLMRGNKEVASFVADGPRCLLKAPSGTYSVRATYQGRTKTATVSTGGRNNQMRW
ncbi:hypothetical protein [Cupriavidus sp. L7L]|uniref:hypothetical protein n=1 Tax=Cupriavidus sp. L7L TaxID=2546443 RepID=UPI00105579A3|nr:hypothetical protein [Cupriavidus sp. L7L]TDF66225.1 hypothetical protein E1J61_10400 [Cupriavidus sp. L7L]